MTTTDSIQSNPDEAKPEAIVGIYLTELDHIMVKVKLSNGCYLNSSIGLLSSILPDDMKDLTRDFSNWRFTPCCE